jgi:N-acetylmuramoyl-L-alanine amidase
MTDTIPKRRLRRYFPLQNGVRSGLLLVGLLVAAVSGYAASLQDRLDQARKYFERAKEQHAEFDKIPVEQRTEKNYTNLMEAYRRVYFTAPTYGNDTICLMAIAQLAEEAATRFDRLEYFKKAIDSYEFLLREYPHSQFRFEALLSIARIHEESLDEPEKALEQYERYLKTFPGTAQSSGVKESIAALRANLDEAASASAGQAPHANDGEAQAASASQGEADATGSQADPATISDIRFWQTRDFTRVVLEMGQQVKYDVGRVESPERLYLDLFDTRVNPPSGKKIDVQDDLLRSIRVAQFNHNTSRVVLDLTDQTEFAISELTNPYRVVIDVSTSERRVLDARGEVPAEAKGPELAAKTPNAVADTETSVIADKIKVADPIPGGAHSLTRALGLKIGRILIDPGHGGHDTGTIGPSGYTEKELVLDVSRRLGRLIEERLGSEVLYTREGDKFISLEERAKMANEQQADLFLSIHANSSRTKTAMGIETYYLSLTADPEALEVAARENAVSQETISELQGLVSKIALSEKVDESREFAEKVQTALREGLAKSKAQKLDRGVKKAPFVVLIGANMPAILAEISFLSNPEEEKRLKTETHRQEIAEALYEGVAGYADTLSGIKPAHARAAESNPTETASLE